MLDADILGPALAEIIREEVARETESLRQQIAGLEKRPDADAVVAMITEALAKAAPEPVDFAAIETRWAGALQTLDDGASRLREFGERIEAMPAVDTEALIAEMREHAQAAAETAAQAALDARPLPLDGKDGLDAPEVTPDQIDASVARYFEANPTPVPMDGKDADAITDEQIADAVRRHIEANPIKHGEDGKDGLNIAGFMVDRAGHLIVTMSDASSRDLGQVVGRDGVDAKGEPGRDGLTLSGFDTELSEDGRILTLSLENDELRVTHELQLPTMIYRGVFKDDVTYVQGDTVTWGGSLWHCDAETTEKPGEGSAAWRLCAKKGRDGKDSK